jgi:hypothetical protein
MGFFSDSINKKKVPAAAASESTSGGFFSGSVQAHKQRISQQNTPSKPAISGRVTNAANLLKQAPAAKSKISFDLTPGATANTTTTSAPKGFDAVDFVKGVVRDTFIRFPASVGEEIGRTALRIAGSDKAEIQTPARETPLGPVETYQSAAQRRIAEGEDPKMAVIKEAGSALLDEPAGIAFKPILAVGSMVFRQMGKKGVKEAVDLISKSSDSEKVAEGLLRLGITDESGELQIKLSKITEPEEIAKAIDDFRIKQAVRSFPTEEIQGRIENLTPQIEVLKDTVKNDPASKLMRYIGRGDNSISELNAKAIGTNRKSAELDEIVTELGYKDMEDAQRGVEQYRQNTMALQSMKSELVALKEQLSQSKNADITVRDLNAELDIADSLQSDVTKITKPKEEFPKIERRAMAAIPEFATPENIEKLRSRTRGVISDEEAYETARSLGITEDQVLNFPVGKILTKEEKTAVSGLVQNNVETLRALEKNLPKALLTPEDEVSRRVVEQYALQKVKVMKMLAVERGIAAETGRALQAHKMLAQSISDEEARIAKFLSDPKVTQDKKDYVLDMISRNGNDPEKMRDLLRKLNDPKFTEMLAEFATAIKLYGIPTHLVNVLTSATRTLLNVPLRATSGAIDTVISKLAGREKERFVREALLEATGQWQGWKESWRDALKALADENYAQEVRKLQDVAPKGPAIRGRLGKDSTYDRFLDVFGKSVRLSFRALGAEDLLIRGPAERGAAYVLVGRAAMKKGIQPGTKEFEKFVAENVFNPSAETLEQMVKIADEALFQSDLAPSMQKINDIRNAFPATKLIVPFFKTLNNLIKQSIEFSPIAPVLPSVRKSLATPGAQSDALSKMVLGTSVILPLTMYAMEDRITLGAPKSAGERDQFYSEGKQPYSILIGENWYPFARFSPFSEWFVTAGLLAKSINNDEEKRFVEVLTDAFFTMSQNMLDKTFVSGLNDLLGALTDPNKAENWLENFATGTTLPTIVGGAARSLDPVVRESEGFLEAYMAKIPGLSDNLPARTDVFGNDVMRPGSALERFVAPVVPSPVKVDLVRQELKDMDYVIGFPDSSAFGMDLTDEQYRQLKVASGKVIYNVLYDIFTTPDFGSLPPGKKEEVVQSVVNRTRNRVKEKLFPELELQKAIKDRLEERGMASDEAEKKAIEIYERIKSEETSSTLPQDTFQ